METKTERLPKYFPIPPGSGMERDDVSGLYYRTADADEAMTRLTDALRRLLAVIDDECECCHSFTCVRCKAQDEANELLRQIDAPAGGKGA